MRPVTARFLRALRGSHRMVARARVVTTWQTGVNPAGTTIPILAGDVQMDGTADIRATLDITTEGRNMWPSRASDLLAPYGNELFVERGIAYGDGTTEWVSLGYYRLDAPEQDDVPDGPIRLAGKDRMAGIVDARMVAPVQIAATATFGEVVGQFVREVYPTALVEWDDPTVRDRRVGRSLICEEDRYGLLRELWESIGKIGYWDHRGILVVRTAPDPDSPVWDVGHGSNGVLVSMSRRLNREGVRNGVAAYGEAADTEEPPRAVAVDDDPASPTYWHGRFGKVPRYFSSPFITTQDQARAAAAAMLRQQLGLPYSADFSAVPNPALEPDDPIRVRYPGNTELHVIASLSVPLTAAGVLAAATREQTKILIGVS